METLPDDHPDAIRGREDLRVVNGIMGNHGWISRMLRRHGRPGWRITEIGAGDGALSRGFCEQGICRPQDLHAFDLAGRPADWPPGASWTQGDLFQQPLPDTEVLVANLFLHHFEDDQLRILGGRLSPQTRLILAAEPARQRIHTWLGRVVCSIAELNFVTRHDMQASIRAGFRSQELPQALGLDEAWRWQVGSTPLGAYHLMAQRGG